MCEPCVYMHVGPEDDLSCVLRSTLLVLLRQSLSLAWGSLTRQGEQVISLSDPLVSPSSATGL